MSIQAMKQALEALETSENGLHEEHLTADGFVRVAITTLRTAIEAVEKAEPVCIVGELCDVSKTDALRRGYTIGQYLYTHPQPAIPAWQPIDMPLYYKTRCADGTIFLNAVSMPAHAIEWCIDAAPKPENSHE